MTIAANNSGPHTLCITTASTLSDQGCGCRGFNRTALVIARALLRRKATSSRVGMTGSRQNGAFFSGGRQSSIKDST